MAARKPKLDAMLEEWLRKAPTDIPALQKIAKIAVAYYAEDASGALQDGAVLLGVARVDNDDPDSDSGGDGFRYLIGLPRGVASTGYLSNFFGRG